MYRKQTVENVICAVKNNAKEFVVYKERKTDISYNEQIKTVRQCLTEMGVSFTEHEENHYKYGVGHVFKFN